jgi:TrmH family RNA methyltransferase
VRKHGEFLLAGRKLVPEFLRDSRLQLKAVVVTEDMQHGFGSPQIPLLVLSSALFKELDQYGTHHPLLWGVVPTLPVVDLNAPPNGLELVLALANPLNLGAALRSAEAFAVERVILLSECAQPFLGKVLRSSSGSALRLPLARGPSVNSVPTFIKPNFWALDMHGHDIGDYEFARDFRLLIGEEGLGVPSDFPGDQRLAIPIKSGMDSLNAVAAASIALYAYRNQHKLFS